MRPERDAMGADEYHPISHHGTNLTAHGGIGYTVVDSIDTMVIMGLTDEYERARAWIADKLTFDVDGNVSTFEVRPICHEPSLPYDGAGHAHGYHERDRRPYVSLEDCSRPTISPRIQSSWRRRRTWQTASSRRLTRPPGSHLRS